MWLFMSIFPSMSKSDFIDILNAKISAMPASLVSALGLDQQFNLQNTMYFFAYCWQFFSIALVIYAINLGSNIISKEHEEKHIDYLVTKPISKGEIITVKVKAGLTLIAITSLFLFLTAWVLVAGYDQTGDYEVIQISRLFIKSFFIYAFFGVVATWLSVMLNKTNRSNMMVLSVFFVSYILGAMSKIIPTAENLKYLSPFYMFESTQAPYGFSATEWWYLAIMVLLGLALYFVALFRYQSKDLI